VSESILPGAWVRFYQGGKIVIGVVNYVTPRNSWERSETLDTDIGPIKADRVLEVRHVAIPVLKDEGTKS
jgi:hypothetical protein